MNREENDKLFQNHEIENSKLKLDSLGLPFQNINQCEPALISGNHLLIPNSLLKDETLFQNILSMKSISKLSQDEKLYLKVKFQKIFFNFSKRDFYLKI